MLGTAINGNGSVEERDGSAAARARGGLNDLVSLDFSPLMKPFPIFANGTSFCPGRGEAVDGRVVDTGCETDKWEMCLRDAMLALAPWAACCCHTAGEK